MDFKNLTEEQKKKLDNCKTPEDYLSCAKEIGYKLSDEELDKINNGLGIENGWHYTQRCPVCGSTNVKCVDDYGVKWHCNDCGADFEVNY